MNIDWADLPDFNGSYIKDQCWSARSVWILFKEIVPCQLVVAVLEIILKKPVVLLEDKAVKNPYLVFARNRQILRNACFLKQSFTISKLLVFKNSCLFDSRRKVARPVLDIFLSKTKKPAVFLQTLYKIICWLFKTADLWIARLKTRCLTFFIQLRSLIAIMITNHWFFRQQIRKQCFFWDNGVYQTHLLV